MKYFFVVGEKSGDLHASNLMQELKCRDAEAQFYGIGGDDMSAAGASLFFHYREMAFMGLFAVLSNMLKVIKCLHRCKREILKIQPDAVVLVDFSGFNMKVAAFAKARGMKVFYYISPKIWAWNRGRGHALKRTVDKMFVILPFEKDFYRKHFDWEVSYVGNPVVDAVRAFRFDHTYDENLKIARQHKNLVAILPGSRPAELRHHMPLLEQIITRNPNLHFIIAAVSSLDKALYKGVKSLPNVTILIDAPYAALSSSRAAIVASGTATLETALLNIPQVVIYRARAIEVALFRLFVKTPFISLVNLILEREAIKELLQEKLTVETLQTEMMKLLDNTSYSDQILADYAELWRRMGADAASANTAEQMIAALRSV